MPDSPGSCFEIFFTLLATEHLFATGFVLLTFFLCIELHSTTAARVDLGALACFQVRLQQFGCGPTLSCRPTEDLPTSLASFGSVCKRVNIQIVLGLKFKGNMCNLMMPINALRLYDNVNRNKTVGFEALVKFTLKF